MADLDYVLYDTAVFTNAANDLLLFQVAQGADATHTEQFTNAFFAGSLPSNVSFDIERIVVFPDYAVPDADVSKIWTASFMELKINDMTWLKLPLALCAGSAAYGGSDTTTAAANAQHVGLLGNGYVLTNKIVIPDGTPFKVRVVQTVALAAASSNIKVCLDGMLHRPT